LQALVEMFIYSNNKVKRRAETDKGCYNLQQMCLETCMQSGNLLPSVGSRSKFICIMQSIREMFALFLSTAAEKKQCLLWRKRTFVFPWTK